MLKSLGYKDDIFEGIDVLKLSEMKNVIASGPGGPEEPGERNCAVLGCKIECSSTCTQCSSGCNQGPDK